MTPIIDPFFDNTTTTVWKDARWLQVEICREFQRGKCTRPDTECRFAHPNEMVQVESGRKVTACFDSMKDRCQRETCKYFHPPHHIKLQLEANGRLFKQQKQQLQALASQHMIQTPATVLPLPVNTLPGVSSVSGVTGVNSVSAFPVTFVSTPVATTTSTGPVATTNSNWRSEKVLPFLEICQDYMQGICSATECVAAHPSTDLLRDSNQKRITVCMDYVKGRCTRESCRYFHPPPHLQGKLKTVKITQSLISTSSRKRVGGARDDSDEHAKQQAMNYTLINTPLALPANFATIVQPSGFPSTTNGMQFAPAFLSTVPLSVPQFAAATTTTPYIHPHIPQLSALSNNHKHIQLPICRDYKSGNCRRDFCRYVHLDNRNVEVIDGKVTICLDATKGKCQRTDCKYYHHTPTNDNKIDGRS